MSERWRGLRPMQALWLGGAVLWGVVELVALNRPQAQRLRIRHERAQPSQPSTA